MSQDLFDDVLKCTTLPSLPAAAARVLELTSDPDVSLRQIAGVVQHDQALSARVLKTVNSSYYGLSERVGSIERAMGYLGLNTVKSIVLGFSLVEMSGDAGEDGFDLTTHWRQTMLGAVGAKLVARRARLDDADEVFSAGLFQDIGVLAMYMALKHRYTSVIGGVDHADLSRAERDAFGFTHAKVGSTMATRWNLPESICEAIEHHHERDAEGVADPDTVRAVIAGTRIAEIHASGASKAALSRLTTMLGRFYPGARFEADALVDQAGREAQELAALFDTDIGEIEDIQGLKSRAEEAGLEHQISMQRQSDRFERESVTDGLTGLANRKGFDADLGRAYRRFTDAGERFGVLFFDTDNFKIVNDTHGHGVGDTVLIGLARRVEAATGEAGTVYRYGGEEFAVILPGAGSEGAATLAERIRAAVEDSVFDLRELDEGPDELAVTVSVGVSCTDSGEPGRVTSAQTLVQEADKKVYEAKAAGRNRVFVWGRSGGGEGAGGDNGPEAEAPPAPAPALDPQDGARPVLVFIEDDPLAATLVKTLLKRYSDPEIHWYTTGEDAVAYFEERVGCGACPCDLVISDMMLPGIHGLEVFEAFRSLGLHEWIPFYILTAGDEKTQREIRDAGVSACITKAEFSRDIGKWLGVLGSPARAVA